MIEKGKIISNSIPYKQFNEETFFKLKNSLEYFGQLKPVICYEENGFYYVVEGHKMFQALCELQNENTEIFCCVISKNDSIKARMLLNELNFEPNYVLLSELFKGIDIEEIKKHLPFSEEEIEKLKSIFNYDWEKLINKNQNINQINLFDFES